MAQFDLPHDHGQDTTQILEHSPSAKEFQDISLLLRQLGDGNRLRLFWILCHCEECVINLSAMMGMSSPAISHHLKQLRTGDLITSRRDGKEVYYRAADNVQAAMLHQLIERLVARICPGTANHVAISKKEKKPDQYLLEQIEIIQTIHQELTEHLDQRFTIEELSKRYLINTSSLKAIFKSIYGAPIATYMKEYRIRKAAELLRETEASIAEVSTRVGYENQSKFTAAFKEIMQMLPSAYRRQYKKQRG